MCSCILQKIVSVNQLVVFGNMDIEQVVQVFFQVKEILLLVVEVMEVLKVYLV